MSQEARFNFVPLRKKKRIEQDLYVKINRTGALIFPKQVIINFIGDLKPFFIELYFDERKRALAFNFLESYSNPEKKSHVRFLKINENCQSHYICTNKCKAIS